MSQPIIIAAGSEVVANGREFIITHVLDLETVLGKSVETGESARLRIEHLLPRSALAPPSESKSKPIVNYELTLVPDDDWQEANRRFNLIRPLLAASRRTAEMVKQVAASTGVHSVTIYRWINSFERTGKVSALLPNRGNGGKGQSRLSPEVEEIARATIEDFYLNKQKRSVQSTVSEVERRCRQANLTAPHANTIRHRINAVSDEKKIARRVGSRAAREQFSAFVNHFPGADFPLSVVQIDHTLLDIEIVDEQERLAIGRPWITVAIDVFSRMIVGFYVSLDPPSAMSVGLCLTQAILPKESWLSALGINTAWNCWGFPVQIHADNAKEFRGEMLKRACQEYGIDLIWRPVATPNYGGHIERLMGTNASKIHELPGTTFSNPRERGDYNSETNAVFTLPELERWLTNLFLGIYHQEFHSGILKSPMKKYEEGILGTRQQPGRGIPPRVHGAQADKLRYDLMPHIERTIQGYGVVIDDIHYYADVLRPFINQMDEMDNRYKRKFVFKRDPRNIREIYFYHPDLKQYYAVPYRNTGFPPISLWELRAVRRRLEQEGYKEIDENLIFETYERMREIEDNAIKTTKSIRRGRQRRAYHNRVKHSSETQQIEVTIDSLVTQDNAIQMPVRILPYDELEKL